ncbi:hypothetical protein [Georgenia deserti]|uniref:DUF3459 domain-containing protein n=1 Tax=Georgenia deserti TaxID=2093781 RepID=A0ABW4L9M5_9MICO
MTESQPEEPAPRLVPAGQITTTLVHRPSRAPAPWWRRAVVYQVHGPAGVDGLAALSPDISLVARLGATAVELRVPAVDPDAADATGVVDELIHRAHQRNLAVIASLAGAPDEELPERAERWLARGANGIDVGLLPADGPTADLGRLQAVVAERDEAVLTGAVSAAHPEVLAEQLLEHWLHVTRDDRLGTTPWDAAQLRATISDAYLQREPAGAAPGWTLADFRGGTPWGLGEDEAARRRRRAATLLMLALPGTVYIRQGESVGVAPAPGDPVPATIADVAALMRAQRGTPGALYERYRHALRLRGELGLATGPLAWVDDAPGSATLALLTRDLLVLTNVSKETAVVPTDRELLHASDDVPLPSDGRLVIPPATTVWLATS